MKFDNLKNQTPLQDDPNPQEKGVLLSDQIAFYAQKNAMIEPFCEEALKPAGYCLHVGEEFMIAGQLFNFEKQKLNELTIEPYDVAVIKIQEKICLPRFLIGRWNIRVKHAYRGLMWVGGAQVDPGFKGHLFCPIYNLSNRPVRLRRGDEIAVIDFVKTTSFKKDEKYTIKFESEKKKNRDFYDYGAQELESALIKQADDIEDVKNQTKSVDTRVSWFITIVVSLLGFLAGAKIFDLQGFPVVGWELCLLLFLSVFVIAKVAGSPLTAAGVRWGMRVLRISPGTSFRVHLFGYSSLGLFTLAFFCVLLYLILYGSPIEELRKEVAELDTRLDKIEKSLYQTQEEKE